MRQFTICGKVLWPGGNEWICVNEQDHGDEHIYWPNELLHSTTTTLNVSDAAAKGKELDQ